MEPPIKTPPSRNRNRKPNRNPNHKKATNQADPSAALRPASLEMIDPATFQGTTPAFKAWQQHINRIIRYRGKDIDSQDEPKGSKTGPALPVSIRAKLALLLCADNAYFGATRAQHVDHEIQFCKELYNETAELVARLIQDEEALQPGHEAVFLEYTRRELPKKNVRGDSGKSSSKRTKTSLPTQKAPNLDDSGKLDARLKVAYGANLTKGILMNRIMGIQSCNQQSLVRIAKRMRHVRTLHFDNNEGEPFYPDLRFLEPISDADFDISRAAERPFDVFDVYQFGAKLGLLHRRNPHSDDVIGSCSWHLRFNSDYPQVFMRAWQEPEPGTDYQQALAAHHDPNHSLKDDDYCIAVDRDKLIQTVDQFLYYPPRHDHAHYASRETAAMIIDALGGVYSVYYPCHLPDGTTGYFRATLRISHYLHHEPHKLTKNDDKAIRVIRCKLNIPSVQGTAELAPHKISVESEIASPHSDSMTEQGGHDASPEEGVERWQYRGRVTSVNDHRHFYLDFALETDAFEARPKRPGNKDNDQSLLPDAVRLVMRKPGHDGDDITTGIVTSINQRSAAHFQKMGTNSDDAVKRQMYASKAIIVKQRFKGDQWIKSHQETVFMRGAPKFFPSLKALQADERTILRGSTTQQRLPELKYALEKMPHNAYAEEIYEAPLPLLSSLEEIEAKLKNEDDPNALFEARVQLSEAIKALQDYYKEHPAGTIFTD